MFSDVRLVNWNQPWWEYLLDGNWQTLQSTEFVVGFFQHTTNSLNQKVELEDQKVGRIPAKQNTIVIILLNVKFRGE